MFKGRVKKGAHQSQIHQYARFIFHLLLFCLFFLFCLGNLEEPKLQQIQMKICRADLHGAIIEVGSLIIQSSIHSILFLIFFYSFVFLPLFQLFVFFRIFSSQNHHVHCQSFQSQFLFVFVQGYSIDFDNFYPKIILLLF